MRYGSARLAFLNSVKRRSDFKVPIVIPSICNWGGSRLFLGAIALAFSALAGGAQYWIGESYYVRREYKSAADAFLRGYKKYKGSDKAPDTLLKLGMSLAELGQKDAACWTFSEVTAKYPNAPEHILDEAKGERKKTGC
jgi:tol-pal system protein YbgF